MRKIIEITNPNIKKLKQLYENSNHHLIFEEYYCGRFSITHRIDFIKFDLYITIKITIKR